MKIPRNVTLKESAESETNNRQSELKQRLTKDKYLSKPTRLPPSAWQRQKQMQDTNLHERIWPDPVATSKYKSIGEIVRRTTPQEREILRKLYFKLEKAIHSHFGKRWETPERRKEALNPHEPQLTIAEESLPKASSPELRRNPEETTPGSQSG